MEERTLDINHIKFVDKKIVCIDCSQEFIFSGGEARYFCSKNLSTPKRCKLCREKRRATLVREEVSHDNG